MKIGIKFVKTNTPKGGYCGCYLCRSGTLLEKIPIEDIHIHKPMKPLYRDCPYADPLKWVCNKCGAETEHTKESDRPNPKFYDK